MTLYDKIAAYSPCNLQEASDRALMLAQLGRYDDLLFRSNPVMHFTASGWVVDAARERVLMVYHNIYQSWSWTGGHADGDRDLAAVALREVTEETGVHSARLLSDGIYSLEVLTVDGHEKRGRYVPSHLHMNVTYLIEADEHEALTVCEDENSGVRWFTLSGALEASTEPWFVERIYRKLNEKLK